MNKIAVCPNSKKHKKFVTVAHVAEDWLVDEQGNFLDVAQDNYHEVVADPDPANSWICAACGAEAKFVKKKE